MLNRLTDTGGISFLRLFIILMQVVIKRKNAKSDGDNWERARMNYFGRFAYNYKEKYLAEFVWRYDGSYMFAAGERFGFFPGVCLDTVFRKRTFGKKISFY